MPKQDRDELRVSVRIIARETVATMVESLSSMLVQNPALYDLTESEIAAEILLAVKWYKENGKTVKELQPLLKELRADAQAGEAKLAGVSLDDQTEGEDANYQD